MLKRKLALDAKQGKSASQKTNEPSTKRPKTSNDQSTSESSTTTDHKAVKAERMIGRDLSHYQNKQRTLCLASRGLTFRDRHLMKDILDLLPHAKSESKFDSKHQLTVLNELAALKNANNILFFESRKKQDLYMFVSRAPRGPSVRFQVQNVHTMAEVKMTGNAMKYSRPLLIFDAAFDQTATPTKATAPLPLIKELLTQVLGAPKGHPKVKPFIDQCLSFFYLDGRIWVRHYQIVYQNDAGEATLGAPALPAAISAKLAKQEVGEPDQTQLPAGTIRLNDSVLLVEIGPRMVLNPIRVFAGSFGGATLWENNNFVSPNTIRAQIKAAKGNEYQTRKDQTDKTKLHKSLARMDDNQVDTVFAQKADE